MYFQRSSRNARNRLVGLLRSVFFFAGLKYIFNDYDNSRPKATGDVTETLLIDNRSPGVLGVLRANEYTR